jgi:hypothetical protein
MRKTTGGHRAAAFEHIAAPEKGPGYLDAVLYVVEGLPGVWRRVRLPKGDPAAAGLLPCWFDGAVVALEYSGAITDELSAGLGVGLTTLNDDERAAAGQMVLDLQEKRLDFLTGERERAAAAQNPVNLAVNGAQVASNGPQCTDDQSTDAAPGVPGSGDVEV